MASGPLTARVATLAKTANSMRRNGCTLREIGMRIGVSTTRVQQLVDQHKRHMERGIASEMAFLEVIVQRINRANRGQEKGAGDHESPTP